MFVNGGTAIYFSVGSKGLSKRQNLRFKLFLQEGDVFIDLLVVFVTLMHEILKYGAWKLAKHIEIMFAFTMGLRQKILSFLVEHSNDGQVGVL